MSDPKDIHSAKPTPPLREKVGRRQLDLLERQLDALGDPPEIAWKVLSIRADRDALCAAIESDPLLAEDVIAAAGSATTALEAIEELGVDGVRAAAAGLAILRAMDGVAADVLDREAFRRHCLAAAAAAELAAQHLPQADPAMAFVCGLTHDIGKLALAACLPKSYQRVLEALSQGEGAEQTEREIIGVDHTVIGRRLAQRWRLPEAAQQVVWLHHQSADAIPSALAGAQMVAIVRYADALAHAHAPSTCPHAAPAQPIAQLAEAIGLSSDDHGIVKEQLHDRIEYWARLLSPGATDTSAAAPAGSADAQLRQMREQLARLERRSRALGELARLATEISPAGPLPALCQLLARTFAAASGVKAAPDRPACTFAISAEGDQAILAAVDAEGSPPRFGFAGCRPLSTPPPPGPRPAGELLRELLDEPAAWSDILDAESYTCLPLLASGRLIGAVLLPMRYQLGDCDEELLDMLAAVGAFFLAAAIDQARANRLTEQLAQTSEELARNKDTLAQAQTLAAVGEMAAGAAHELNNPLAVIAGRAQLMADQARTDQDRATINLIRRKAEEISNITSELMEFARPSPPKPEAIDPQGLLNRAKDAFLAEHDQKEAPVEVDIHIGPDCQSVLADVAQLGEVLHELLANAVTAAGGPVKIRMAASTQDRPGLEHPPQVLVRVSDDGPGMDNSTAAAAFTPFFSYRPAGRGRGMGLARARRYIQANGGRIWIDAHGPEGTDICIELPQTGSEGKRHE